MTKNHTDDSVGVTSPRGRSVGTLRVSQMDEILEAVRDESGTLAWAPPIINAMGTLTSLGGSRMSPSVVAAMVRASRSFVDMNGLYVGAGKRITELCRAPDGFDAQICTGVAAGLALAAAACMLPDVESASLLPDQANRMPRRVVLVDGGSDTRWEQSIKLSGALVVRLGTGGAPMGASDLASAPWSEAAAFFYFAGEWHPPCPLQHAGPPTAGHWANAKRFLAGGLPESGDGASPLRFNDLVHECAQRGVPLVVDAAAQLPPRSNLWRWTRLGADIVMFSGGKAIGGPQGTGIVLGRKRLIGLVLSSPPPPHRALVRVWLVCRSELAVERVAPLEYPWIIPFSAPGSIPPLECFLEYPLESLGVYFREPFGSVSWMRKPSQLCWLSGGLCTQAACA